MRIPTLDINGVPKPRPRIGAYRIVPNLAHEQAVTIEAFSADEAIAAFERARPGVAIHDVILLRPALFPVATKRGYIMITVPDRES